MSMSSNGLSWSLLASMAGGILSGPDGIMAGLVCVDSRMVQSGDLFVALSGNNVDGHDYVENAALKGAECALVRTDWNCCRKGIPEDFRFIKVDDPEKSLIQVARSRLKELRNIVAVTGSVGKTSTREMIFAALGGASRRIYRARSSHNTKIGCAITIAEMPIDTSALILEMGTNHPGEIAEMVDLYPPDIAVITEIAPAHLEGLGNLTGVLKAKLEILESKRLEKVVFNSDNVMLSSALRKEREKDVAWRSVSVGKKGDYTVTDCGLEWKGHPAISMEIRMRKDDSRHKIHAEVSGLHNTKLLGLAWATAVEMGTLPTEASERLSGMKSYDGRGVFKRKNGLFVLDETYNANPKSMDATLDLIKQSPFPFEKRILVLGEMKELGDQSSVFHRELLKKASSIGRLFLFGDQWAELNPSTKVYRDMDELSRDVSVSLSRGCLLVVKGSRSNHLEYLLEKVL